MDVSESIPAVHAGKPDAAGGDGLDPAASPGGKIYI
jgi:hypothetical protein